MLEEEYSKEDYNKFLENVHSLIDKIKNEPI